MKKLALLSFTALFFASCENLKDAADITFETTFTHIIDVSETTPNQSNGSFSFSETDSINLNEGDVAEYVDKLKDIKIKSVKLEILSYTGTPDAEITGSVDVGGGFAINIPPTNLDAIYNGAKTIDLSEQSGAFNYIKDQLLAQKLLSYTLNGSISEVPVSTQMKLVYTLDVTANPL